jgi:hypothetical protein
MRGRCGFSRWTPERVFGNCCHEHMLTLQRPFGQGCHLPHLLQSSTVPLRTKSVVDGHRDVQNTL